MFVFGRSHIENWITLSVCVIFLNSALYLFHKQLGIYHVPASFVVLFDVSLAVPLYFGYNLLFTENFGNLSLYICWKSLLCLIGVTIVFVVGGLIHIKAIQLSPNPGYCASIISLQLIVITGLSSLLQGTPFDVRKFVGIGLCILGGLMVCL